MTYLFNSVSRNEENILPAPEKQITYPKLVLQVSRLWGVLSTWMLAAKTDVKIVLCAGSPVISASYCYFSF